ncbi:MAG: hypothetical protein FWF08_07705, partial [Oscillospiraceae bacterium]|nr:hypothetical protein [Oscillospiraceae bacterium]
MSQPLTMRKKAEIFEYDMMTRFMLDGQVLCKLKNPTPEAPFISYNMPDDAYMTGMMAAVFSFKYAVTKDPEDKKTVSKLLGGLDMLCRVSGKKGLLARAWWPLDNPNFSDGDKWTVNEEMGVRWNGDVSTDQMDGVFFGFYYAYKLAADEKEKKAIAHNVSELIDAVIENDFRIVDITGEMTRWGNYQVEHLIAEEHLHGLLLLQHLKIAEFVTGDKKYGDLYREIAVDKQLAGYTVTAWIPVPPPFANHSDNVMHIMELLPLLELETDPDLYNTYLQGLRVLANGYSKEDITLPNGMTPYEFMENRFRSADLGISGGMADMMVNAVQNFWNGDPIHHGIGVAGEPLFNYAFMKYFNCTEEGVPVTGTETLRLFPFYIKWNRGTIEKYEKQFG